MKSDEAFERFPDRRCAERLLYSKKVAIFWDEGRLQANAVNLSESGIFIETTNFLKVGTPVRLSFKVSGAGQQQSVRAEGRVVRNMTPHAADLGSPLGFGTCFEQVSEGKTALFDFLKKASEDQHTATGGR